jgi:hypothetical protein
MDASTPLAKLTVTSLNKIDKSSMYIAANS